jgi:hypothetical protein
LRSATAPPPPVGQIGSTSTGGSLGIAVSPPDGNAAIGKVYLADSANQRVNTYDLDGRNPDSFGSSSNFGFNQPRRVAVDSRGIVYASDSNNGGEVDRYDSLDANGGGVGFLASIPASVNEVQRIDFTNFDFFEGVFRLTCPNGTQTADIDYSVNASGTQSIQKALAAACGNVSVNGTPGSGVTLTFQRAFGSRNVPTTTCLVVSSRFGSCSVTTLTEGSTSTLLAGSTSGLAIDPDSDGAGTEKDTLYVLRTTSGEGAVQQFGPVNDPGLVAVPGAADAVHGTAAGFNDNVSGLGLDDRSGRLYVASTQFFSSVGSGHRVYVLDDAAGDPAMILNPVTVKTDTTATLSATVDPRGGLIRCTFQYATDLRFTNSVEVAVSGCDSFNPDGGYQALSRRVTGLTPNTHYFVRLVVARTFDPSAAAASAPIQFDTDSVPPVISDVGAIQVQDTSARLVGTIDPRNSATGYVFQYGTTPALGSSTAPLNIGGGTRLITVSQVVSGLSRDTGYFFRLVATNEFGTTNGTTKTFHTRAVPFPPADPGNCPNEAIRQAQGSTHLPDCRAYEMVSPPDKNQGSLGGRGNTNGSEGVHASFSRDGQAVAFCASSLFGEPSGQLSNTCAQYISRRGPGGWTTVNPLPRFCASDPFTGNGGVFAGSRNVLLAPQSFDRYAMATPEFAGCEFYPLVTGAPADSYNAYRGDLSTDPISFDLLTPNQSSGIGQNQLYPIGGSDDLSHVVYATLTNQTPDSPAPGDYYKLYAWAELGAGDCNTLSADYDAALRGCLSLVSKDPGGAAIADNTKLPAYNKGAASVAIPSAVSDDGERIYFQGPGAGGGSFGAGDCSDAACNLYLRESGATIQVSASECTSPCGVESGTDNFLWATPSGEVAFFDSCARLTDASAEGESCPAAIDTGSNLKLYRWDRNALPGDRLIDLTVDNEPADGSQPQALDIVDASSDESADPADDAAPGNTVFFVAGGQIVAGEPTGSISGTSLKLYRWRWNDGTPSVDYLGPYLSAQDNGQDVNTNSTFANSTSTDPNTDRNHVRVTPDGRYLVIQTKLAFDAAADRDSDADMYRWDDEGGWLCISCQLPGAPSAGHVSAFTPFLYYNALYGDLGNTVPEHRISDDGKTIFFSTPDALVPEDVNGESGCPSDGQDTVGFASFLSYECADIYEWHDGTVSLVTSGTGTRPFALIGATADGSEVFFSTAQRMVGWDLDTQIDIYAARTDGGFPEPPPVPPACDLESGGCEGPATVAPSTAGAGTAAFQGQENLRPTPPRTCPRGKRRVTRNGRTRCVAKKRKRHNRAAKHNRRASR